jgi:hypothetical protein
MGKEIYIVKLNGYGYKNGNVYIDKIIEIEDFNEYQKFLGAKKYSEISRVIKFHYPDIDFDPKKISVSTNTKKIKSSNKKSNLVTGAIGGFVAGKLSNNKKASAKKADSNNEEIEIIESFAHELKGIHNLTFSNNIEDVTNKLDLIYNKLRFYKWKSTNEDKNKQVVTKNNQSLTKGLLSYTIGLEKLKELTEDKKVLKKYKSKGKRLLFKKIWNKYSLWVVFLTMMLVLLILAIIAENK